MHLTKRDLRIIAAVYGLPRWRSWWFDAPALLEIVLSRILKHHQTGSGTISRVPEPQLTRLLTDKRFVKWAVLHHRELMIARAVPHNPER